MVSAQTINRRRPHDDHVAFGSGVVHAGVTGRTGDDDRAASVASLGGQGPPHHRRACRVGRDVHTGDRAGRSGHQDHTAAVGMDHAADLQVGERDGLQPACGNIDHQGSGSLRLVGDVHRPDVRVDGRQQTSVRQQHRSAGSPFHPGVVEAICNGGHVPRAGTGVLHDERLLTTLAPVHDHQHQPRQGPRDVDEVGEHVPIPEDLRPGTVGGVHQPQRHVGVRRAGGRVAVRNRRTIRVGRVGDPPPLHRRAVDPCDRQARSVRAPPVAAEPVELLGGDEVGHAPGDIVVVAVVVAVVLLVLSDEEPVPGRAVRRHHAHRAVGHVRHRGAVRRQTGVEGPPDARQGYRRGLLPLAGACGVQPAPQGEHHPAAVGARGVRGDAVGLLPHALTACPLGHRQLLVPFGQQRERIGHQAFRIRRHVQVDSPEAVDGIAAAAAAQEQHRRPPGQDGDGPWLSEGQPPGTGILARERVGGHHPTLTAAPALERSFRPPPIVERRARHDSTGRWTLWSPGRIVTCRIGRGFGT